MSWTPFFLKRIGPKGADTAKHMFCVGAKGDPELVRTGESDAEVLVNGSLGAQAREPVQRLVDALNAVWEDYLDGKFCEDAQNDVVSNGVYVCTRCGYTTQSPSAMSRHERDNAGHNIKFVEADYETA